MHAYTGRVHVTTSHVFVQYPQSRTFGWEQDGSVNLQICSPALGGTMLSERMYLLPGAAHSSANLTLATTTHGLCSSDMRPLCTHCDTTHPKL